MVSDLWYPNRKYFDPQFFLIFRNLQCIPLPVYIGEWMILTHTDWAFAKINCWWSMCPSCADIPVVENVLEVVWWTVLSLRWRHNELDGVSDHQPHGCLLNRLFRRRSKTTSKLRVTGLCVGNSPGPANSPHKGPVTRNMLPFDDAIMIWKWCGLA